MPLVWSSLPKLGPVRQFPVVILFSVVPQWFEMEAGRGCATDISANKVVVGSLGLFEGRWWCRLIGCCFSSYSLQPPRRWRSERVGRSSMLIF
jgi:hypothetical protein